MADFVVRPIETDELQAVSDVIQRALQQPYVEEEDWPYRRRLYEPERIIAAFDGQEPIGAVSSFRTELGIPGGGSLTTAAVDGVAVRADHTRRGVMTALTGHQLRDCRRRGDQTAYLRSSEAEIYGRFGYGIATIGLTRRLSMKARFRADAPEVGTVRLVDPSTASERISALYAKLGLYRPGIMARPDAWWPGRFGKFVERKARYLTAVHSGNDGTEDGYVVYRYVPRHTFEDPELDMGIEVYDLHATTPAALSGLWQYLLSADSVSGIVAPNRPVDENLELMLTDARAYQISASRDDTWLRILDVSGALQARTYRDAEPVVLDVVDQLLSENSGQYRISVDGVEQVSVSTPDIRLGIEELGTIYMGTWSPSELAAAGRLTVADAQKLAAADELFRVTTKPWCGTRF